MVAQQARNDEKLLDLAIRQLAEMTDIRLEVAELGYPIAPGRRVDALARFANHPHQEPYAIGIKRHLTPARLGQVAQQLATVPFAGMVVTDYVNPKMADRLKELNIAFIDLAGNAYINRPPIYIYVRGNRPIPETELGKEPRPTRAFQATGLKVLFAFLEQPTLLQASYRDIAKATDVALGTVGWVLKDLKEHGYLLEENKSKRRLIRKKALIDRWVTAYPEKLRPKLRLGRYQADDNTWWRHVDITRHGALWGGEVAAAKLTGYLRPLITTIYTHELPAKLLLENQLKKDPDGNVEILNQFWTGQFEKHNQIIGQENTPLAPTLLVYADLLATADARNIETAKILYNDYFDRYIAKDQ